MDHYINESVYETCMHSFQRKKTFNVFNSLIVAFVLFSVVQMLSILNPNTAFSSHLPESSTSHNEKKRIALIENTFTYAAYQNGSFYNFYDLHSPEMYTREGQGLNTTITENLYLLKDRPIPQGPFPFYLHPEYKDIPYITYAYLILDLVHKNNQSIVNLTDADVDQGKIFFADGENAYDVLILLHNEYVSQKEYDNLKRFVANGGTILFTEGNVLYAEVDYNSTTNTISLVKGHDWEFDGKSARNSINERWLKENKEWMGSNFLDYSSSKPLHFGFNPFNYTHYEEQYLTNPNATILIDYEAYGFPEEYENATIATYYMDYGLGRVIHLSLWGHTIDENPIFVEYFEKILLPLALGKNVTEENKHFTDERKLHLGNSTDTAS
ncbi:conserved exported protein of unknown function [Candidatus Nitrosocosmicus franklandus]|uniref:N,N-dimethylformamidase beta subunit-like C-terminal domain-containing protein n=2 Tax=Candidatus Nitrosocosmicus franklandianus TaxID=1798806 RepID=A0A484I7H5_9ARCH|nr:conserved exported protein of unknown function [Candidatus Nitrosocosmicus franklandus]